MGSTPPAGTSIFNELLFFYKSIALCRLRLGCRKLRSYRSVQLIDTCHVRTWKQVPVNIGGHLNAAMTHLVPDVRQWRTSLNRQMPEGVTKIMEPNAPESSLLHNGQEVAVV